MNKRDLRIIFIGTPDFSVESLKKLINEKYNIVGVITAPDKPAGRGRKLNQSAVKKYALSKNIKVLQAEKLKNPIFIEELKSLKANLQIVIAFRMLPKIIWDMPEFGTFNLHASYLPQYRGAAPINWAVINGEKETGLTTFFLKQKIDTGNIIFREKIDILPTETAGDLHDKLMLKGADLVLKTVKSIENQDYKLTKQEDLFENSEDIKPAPKIFKQFGLINWNDELNKIYNHIRGLSPYPTAWTIVLKNDKKLNLKIFDVEIKNEKHDISVGKFISDNKTFLKISVKNGFIFFKTLQLEGKKRMSVEEFLKGIDVKYFCLK